MDLTHDRSWGVRYQVGAPVADVRPGHELTGVTMLMVWSPILFTRNDGSHYGLHVYYQRHAVGTYQHVRVGSNSLTGPSSNWRHFFRSRLPGRQSTPAGRHAALHHGRRIGPGPDGHPVSDTGFHLGAALYFGLDGHWHGEWRGTEHLEGEYVADCSEPGVAQRLLKFTSTVVRVEDPTGGGVGYGDCQTLAVGPDEAKGLTEGHVVHVMLAFAWSTIASLATAGGTLVLGLATFASSRWANRAARVAERSLQFGLQPIFTASASRILRNEWPSVIATGSLSRVPVPWWN